MAQAAELTLPSTRAVRPMASTFAYYAAFIALGLVAASLGPTLTGLAENTRTQIDQISLLFTARASGYFLGSLLAGRLYDRVPGHLLMGLMLLVMALTMALTPLIGQFVVLVAVLLFMGIGEAGVDVGGNAMLVWIHRSRVGPFMNALHFCFGVGAFISPIIVAQAILLTDGIAGAYWMLALAIAPIGLWVLRLASPHAPSASSSLAAPIRVNHRLLALCALFLLLYVGAEVSFGGWIFTYAVTLGMAQAANAAYLTSVFWGALTLGRLLAMPIAAKVRPRTILLVDMIGCLASVSMILVWSESSAVLWLGTFGMGLAMASIFPTVISWAERRMTMSGSATSWFLVGSSIGAITFPWLIGQMFESIGPQVAMWMILALLIADTVLFGVLMIVGGPPHTDE